MEARAGRGFSERLSSSQIPVQPFQVDQSEADLSWVRWEPTCLSGPRRAPNSFLEEQRVAIWQTTGTVGPDRWVGFSRIKLSLSPKFRVACASKILKVSHPN